MLVRDVMTAPVLTVHTCTPVNQAAQLLITHGFTGVPVLDDDDHLVGIVTESDLLRGRILIDPRRLGGHQPSTGSAARTVADVMTAVVESLTPGADAADAARIMIDERIRCLPIVDGPHLVGVLTRRDLLRATLSGTADVAGHLHSSQ